jgi:hypothetical protein
METKQKYVPLRFGQTSISWIKLQKNRILPREHSQCPSKHYYYNNVMSYSYLIATGNDFELLLHSSSKDRKKKDLKMTSKIKFKQYGRGQQYLYINIVSFYTIAWHVASL